MKKIFIFPMVISFAMICACQKQDSAADAQLAQRKTELDVREKALDEREKAVSEWEKAMTKFRAIPSDLQSRKPTVDPEQAKAEREKRIQQLPPNFRRSFETAHCWMPEQLKKAGEQKTDPYNYSVVSKRHAERRWAR
jgi:hypothetical protein